MATEPELRERVQPYVSRILQAMLHDNVNGAVDGIADLYGEHGSDGLGEAVTMWIDVGLVSSGHTEHLTGKERAPFSALLAGIRYW